MMQPLRGKALQPGAKIAVVAPSGPVPRERFEAGVVALQGRYELVYDADILFARDGFVAGPDTQRLAALNAALANPDCDAVWMARGGYGLTRIQGGLDFSVLRANPKPVIGFSDGTALLCALFGAGIAAVHGPVVTQMSTLCLQDQTALFDLLENPAPPAALQGLQALAPGQASGPLVGGNLEVFSRLLGTAFLPDLRGAVLLLEDVGERPYRVDRLLTHLKNAGVFDSIAGLVFGDFFTCEEPAGSPTADCDVMTVLKRCTRDLAIPVLCNAPVGHGTRNRALPHGVRVQMDADTGRVEFSSGVVL